MNSIVKLGDCMDFMREMPDKAYNLAIVDPPYGIKANHSMGRRKGEKASPYKTIRWDNNPPDADYFQELFRVSENQIIWGGNYMTDFLPPSKCWLLWDKCFSDSISFGQFEMAWTSFNGATKKFEYSSASNNALNRIHPTQKPVALYTWLLKNYAKEGDKILDTHGGSMSSVIAAIKGGFDITCFELDKDYYEKAKERIENFISQENMFAEKPIITFS